jgi:hypothetical protein
VTYVLDGRDAAALLTELRAIAATTPLPPSLGLVGASWDDALFGNATTADDEPSRALLLALLQAHAGVVAHLDALPARARRSHLEGRLGISRLPVVPDRVVAVVEGDPKRLPVTLPKGARLKAGRTRYGDRVYETVEALAVLGAGVLGAHSHRLSGAGDRIARHVEGLMDGTTAPFAPFGGDAEAPHELIVASDLLRFDGAPATVTLGLTGVRIRGAVAGSQRVRDVLSGLVFRVPSADGGWQTLGRERVSREASDEYSIKLSVSAPTAPIPLAGENRYTLHCALPRGGTAGFPRQDALRLDFRAATLHVSARQLVPQAAYANDGLVDVTSELEPFGPVPRRGATFTVRCDEAFGKPLATLTIGLAKVSGTGEAASKVARSLRWETPTGERWQEFARGTELQGVLASVESGGAPFAAVTTVAGQPGRHVRVRVAAGDFGWEAYEQKLRDDAVVVAKRETASLNALTAATPPVAPVLSSVQLGYTTETVSSGTGALSLYAVNGLSLPVALTGAALQPFELEPAHRQGALYIGLDEQAVPGEVVALYADIDEADACDPAPREAVISFAYDAGAAGWRPLDAVDGTLGLRQSGIVRFVAPLDWALGSAAAGAEAGRWLRVETTAPGLAGSVRRLQTDAVEARYVVAAGDDDTPATPLPAGAVTALAAAIPGIKKVTNPRPSWGGRGPEPEARFAARASGVVRHRDRAITAWDVEELVRHAFPDLALVRCLPHHSRTSECAPGWLAIVAVPRSGERMPVPTVRMAADIDRFVREHSTAWLQVAVLCAEFAAVGVGATAVLRRGVVAGEARAAVERDLRAFLHPLGGLRRRGGFGRPLFRSEVVHFLEGHPLVDFVGEDGVEFLGAHAGLERVDVHACRGLIASAAEHELKVRATL